MCAKHTGFFKVNVVKSNEVCHQYGGKDLFNFSKVPQSCISNIGGAASSFEGTGAGGRGGPVSQIDGATGDCDSFSESGKKAMCSPVPAAGTDGRYERVPAKTFLHPWEASCTRHRSLRHGSLRQNARGRGKQRPSLPRSERAWSENAGL